MEKIQDEILWPIVKIMAVSSVIMAVGLFVYFAFVYNPDDSKMEKRLKIMNAQIDQLQKQVDTLKIKPLKTEVIPGGASKPQESVGNIND